ncbi:MAG: TonB family protein [Flavobacteriales bacterium]|nr:TonB family protein [Flavobacteriales bacterium]MCB9177861.1 TonB family protein [Flavobacteriales bacterium]
MRLFLAVPFLVLTLSSTALTAGDPKSGRIYLSEVLEPTTKGKASYYMQADGKAGELFIGKIFTMDGKLKAEGHFLDEKLTLEQGPFVFYHPNGKVESKGEYLKGRKTGIWLRYDPWGGALAEKVYDPEPLENILYTRAETMPAFKGGDERAFVRVIKEGVKLPAGSVVKGPVMASFVVEKNGELSDVKVIEGQDKAVDEQVVDVIKSTSPWTPGAEKGVPVRVQMRVPVQF